jgi:hypothetical protein
VTESTRPRNQSRISPKKLNIINFITQGTHLFCRECEQRVAKFGEAPAFALINRGNTVQLLDRMKSASPIEAYAQLAAYSCRAMGIDN